MQHTLYLHAQVAAAMPSGGDGGDEEREELRTNWVDSVDGSTPD
jgi:hypothetical protein